MKNINLRKLAAMAALAALASGCGQSNDTGMAAQDISDTTVGAPPVVNTGADTSVAVVTPDPTSNLTASDTGGAANAQSGSDSGAATESARYIDYQVVDREGAPVGTIDAIWEDSQGQPAYLAVKRTGTDEIFVAPAASAQASQNRSAVRLPFAIATLKEAPAFEKEADLDQESEKRIAAFYQSREPQAASANPDQQDQASIRLREEQLKVGTRQVSNGGVLLRKVVRTETVNKPVQLQREEIVIERVPGGGEKVEGNIQFSNQDIFIPLRREEAVIQKDVRLKEVVNVGKDIEQETTEVNAQLREEELKVIKQEQQTATGAPGAAATGTAAAQRDTQQQEPDAEAPTPNSASE